MTAARVLAQLHSLGVAAEARGDRLVLRPASAVPADLLAEIKAAKPELLTLLAANDPAGGTGAQVALADVLARREIDPEERAAITAEPTLPPIGTPARTRSDERHQAQLAGLLEASLKRPSSWQLSWPNTPTPGATCSRCRGTRFWTQDGGHGWRCAVCHPALGGQAVTEVGNKDTK